MPLISGINWTPVPDGETHEHVATINGRVVRVYSDTSGQTWEYEVEDAISGLLAATLEDALLEATRDVRQW